MPVGAALLHTRLHAMPALGPLADVGQVFQAKECVWVGVYNAPTDEVVALLLQPSLSPRDHDEAPCRRASAFLLQALPQSRIVVRFRTYRFAGKEGHLVLGVRCHRQIALAHI